VLVATPLSVAGQDHSAELRRGSLPVSPSIRSRCAARFDMSVTNGVNRSGSAGLHSWCKLHPRDAMVTVNAAARGPRAAERLHDALLLVAVVASP